MKKRFFQSNHFFQLIQFYKQSRNRKKVLQHLQSESKKSKINVKGMFNSNFFQKASVSFKQLIGKNIASFFYQNLPSNSLKQSYDSACSHTPQQIVTCNTNTCQLHQQTFLENIDCHSYFH